MTNCKSKLVLSVLILIAYFHLSEQSDVITIPESNTNWLNVKDWDGLPIFQVLGSTVIVPNNRRANSSIKFSLGSSSIVQIENKATYFWTFHLQDKSRVYFSVKYSCDATYHYYLLWHGGGPNGPEREVCFHPDFNNATWFDTYQPRSSASWPMKISEDQYKKPFNNLHVHDEQVGELIFYNSDGFAVVLDENQPLYTRRQAGEDSQLCFSVNNTNDFYPNKPDPTYLDIKVHLYSAANIRTVSDYVIALSPHVPKPSVTPPEDAFARTSWMYYDISSDGKSVDYSAILNRLVENGFTHGEIVNGWIDGGISRKLWPAGLDSFLPTFVEHGFQLKYIVPYTINPGKDNIPESERYRFTGGDGFPCYTVDYSNPSAVEWFASENNQLLRNFHGKIHSVQASRFRCYGGASYKCYDEQYEKYPNRLLSKYVETIANLKELNSSSYVSTQVAYKNQHLPIVVQLWMLGQYWQYPNTAGYLQSLITHALSVSMSGYSYFATNPIGSPDAGLTEELYIRWVQASTFMPHMTFYRSPWIHGQTTVNITRSFVNLHTQYVPLMMQLARERVRTGSPLVRPMWYIEPDNREVYGIVDQFMLGTDLVVAPVLKTGVRERTVHLPPGNWLDQRGIRFEGAKQVTVPVPLEELAYFTRV